MKLSVLICTSVIILIVAEKWSGRSFCSFGDTICWWWNCLDPLAFGHYRVPNSQCVLDCWSITHVTHGFIFLRVLRLFLPARRSKSTAQKIIKIGVIIETVFEIAENTNWGVAAFRDDTYQGDSILNSLSDFFFCTLALCWGAKRTTWTLVVLIFAIECFCLAWFQNSLLYQAVSLMGVRPIS